MTDRDGLQDSAYGWVEKHDSVKRKRADGKKWMIGNLNEERKRRKVGDDKRKVGDDKRNGMIGNLNEQRKRQESWGDKRNGIRGNLNETTNAGELGMTKEMG